VFGLSLNTKAVFFGKAEFSASLFSLQSHDPSEIIMLILWSNIS